MEESIPEKLLKRIQKHPWLASFGGAFLTVLISIPIAGKAFSGVEELGAAALAALMLSPLMRLYLEENKEAIWEKKISPYRANAILAARFATLFLGVFVAAILIHGSSPESYLSKNINKALSFRNDYSFLFEHNLKILFAGMLFSILYRAGGLMLILAWNGLHWSQSFLFYFFEISSESGILDAAIVIASLLPHLFLEVLAYVLGGLGGVFLSKAVVKYPLSSVAFYRVSRASLLLLLIATLVLSLATFFEVYLAQSIFHS